jgi:N-acetylmuramoyl-L-alanine amidase
MSRTKDENDPIAEEVRECNAFAPDLAIDVHNNAGGGDGFEAIVSIRGGRDLTLAKNIETEVKAIGQNSRGIKVKANDNGADYFAFIRSVKCPSIILEGVFVDNKTDVKIADTVAEQKAFGVAYAKGILKTLGIAEKKTSSTKKATSSTKKETATKKDNSFTVRVNIDNLYIRSGAGTQYDRKSFIKPGVYTITEKKTGKGSVKGWGKLKSGAGWIALDYVERL